MNQHLFLEQLWREVIEGDGPPDPWALRVRAGLAGVRTADIHRVARVARYAAVFKWCYLFDEAGIAPAAWLAPEAGSRWESLTEPPDWGLSTPEADLADPAQLPLFREAGEALARLRAAGVAQAALQHLAARAHQGALEGVRRVLGQHSFGPEDLEGLHESLILAAPTHIVGPCDDPAPGKGGMPPALVEVAHGFMLAFSPEGDRIVSAVDGRVTAIATGEVLAVCRWVANTGRVAWSPDGRWLLGTGTAGAIALCDARTGARTHVLSMTCEGAGAVFSPDGSRVYAGDWKGSVFAWDVRSGRELCRREMDGGMVERVRAPGRRGALDLVVTYRPRPTVLRTLTESLDAVGPDLPLPEGTREVVWEPRARRALVLDRGSIARMDGAGHLTDRRAVDGGAALEISPDGRWYALAHAGGFRLGSIDDLDGRVEVPMDNASGAAFSRDSRRVALATWQGGGVWDVRALLDR